MLFRLTLLNHRMLRVKEVDAWLTKCLCRLGPGGLVHSRLYDSAVLTQRMGGAR